MNMLNNAVQKDKLLEFFYDALGPVKPFLDDLDVTDIMLNPDGVLWLDTFSRGSFATDYKLVPEKSEQIIRIASGINGNYCNPEHPSVALELPLTGDRFQGIMPPQSQAPIFAIRKKPHKIFSLAEYLENNIINHEQYNFLVDSINKKRNIVVAGATGSGKTTFANALLAEIAKLNTRIAVLEDTLELQCRAKNSYNFKTCSNVSMRQLLKDTLRMNIDSIVVGEVRGAEALDLLKAWSTGHPGGVATIHSDSALDALYRLEQLIQEATNSPQQNLIARSVDIVVFLAKNNERKRRVKEILIVNGLKRTNNPYQVQILLGDGSEQKPN